MTNFEFYKDEIQKITECNNGTVAVVDDKPVPCNSVHRCKSCAFNGASCAKGITKWLYAEHVEKPTLTKKERAFCEFLGSGFIARDYNGCLAFNPNGFTDKSYSSGQWVYIGPGPYTTRLDVDIFTKSFPFITWKDKEPWSVEDLLKLEVKE